MNKKYTLRHEVNKIEINKDNVYYNESFCHVVYDYLGSKGIENLTEDDLLVLKENDYDIGDFIDDSTDNGIIDAEDLYNWLNKKYKCSKENSNYLFKLIKEYGYNCYIICNNIYIYEYLIENVEYYNQEDFIYLWKSILENKIQYDIENETIKNNINNLIEQFKKNTEIYKCINNKHPLLKGGIK